MNTYVYEQLNSTNIFGMRTGEPQGPLRHAPKDISYDWWINQNQMGRIRYPSPDTREPQPFTPQEIEKILAQLQGQEKNLIQFAFWSGLRTSELIGLRWQDVELEQNRIHIRTAIVRKREKTTKTTSGVRTVELQTAAREAIENQKQLNPCGARVFHDPTTSLPWLGDHIVRKRIWIPALESANIKYRNPYQARHTFASMLLSAGRNPLWVAQQMGHKDWGMIRKTYGRWIPQNKERD